jgi:multiple sugar transport system ATP-binding protein
MASVIFKQVTKRFGPVSVIEGLDLEIQDHEFMVLVGPSGCGKSTALRMIAGLEDITGGTISIGDRVVNDVPPKDRDVAMVFQSYALYPHMTVRENLEFGLRIRKTPRAEIDRLVPDAAQVLGIQQLMERKPKELSGGQRQRVALGRAIVRKPSVFLFDEPLSNLDAKLRVEVRAEIKKLQARLRTTTVYVTHDQVEAMTMGHRIAILNAGKLQQVGAPLEVYEKPANLFSAGFIGTPPMNLVKATLGPGGNTARAAGFETPVPASARGSAEEGRKVVLGIRPENVVPPGREARGATHRLPLTVEIIEVLGDEVVIHGRAGEDTLVFKQDPHRSAAVGSIVEVQLELDSLHVFDAENERRLGT